MDKDDYLQMKPSIIRFREAVSGAQALAADRQSQKEEMIEAGAIAMIYEAYLLVAMKTNPHYAHAVLRMVTDDFIDIRNMMEKDEHAPWQGM